MEGFDFEKIKPRCPECGEPIARIEYTSEAVCYDGEHGVETAWMMDGYKVCPNGHREMIVPA